MGETKAKKPVRRLKKVEAANSPLPMSLGSDEATEDPACGHSGCNRQCHVRYVGPTTHIRDHHILHAARGATHAWTAALVAGLAVVLTGTIAYTAVEAQTPKADRAMKDVVERLANVEDALQQVLDQCRFVPNDNAAVVPPVDTPAPATGDDTRAACIDACQKMIASDANTTTNLDQCIATKCAALKK